MDTPSRKHGTKNTTGITMNRRRPPSLRAGAARVDITPAMGIQLAGDIGRHRPVEEIRDPEPLWKDATRTAVEWDWVYAAGRLDMARHIERNPLFDYLVQAFRLGGISVLAVAGEPFVEEQLRIKRESPFAYTFTAHMSNHYVGYLPTPEAILKDSFETRTSTGSRLVPEALRLVGDQSLSLLKELSDKR